MIRSVGRFLSLQFFEHGSAEQRKELANNLAGHVLPLSLQMYGCRVIQKVPSASFCLLTICFETLILLFGSLEFGLILDAMTK